jgi:hypothetical protein
MDIGDSAFQGQAAGFFHVFKELCLSKYRDNFNFYLWETAYAHSD